MDYEILFIVVQRVIRCNPCKVSKYSNCGGETSLDGSELRAEAQQEKEQLITELREDLEVTSRSTTSEQLNQVSDNLQENLRKVPNFLYIG